MGLNRHSFCIHRLGMREKKQNSFNKIHGLLSRRLVFPCFSGHALPKSFFTRNSFPTSRTGNPVDTFDHFNDVDGKHNTVVYTDEDAFSGYS